MLNLVVADDNFHYAKTLINYSCLFENSRVLFKILKKGQQVNTILLNLLITKLQMQVS